MARQDRSSEGRRAATRKPVLGNNPFDSPKSQKPKASKTGAKRAPSTKRVPKKVAPAKAKPEKKGRPAREISKRKGASARKVTEPALQSPQPPVTERIRELESQLDAIIERGQADAEPGTSAHEPTTAQGSEVGEVDGTMLDAARDLLSSSFYLRQWGRMGVLDHSEQVDDFGHDPKVDIQVQPLLELVYDRYFRTVTEGLANVPAQGRALVVVNHGGTFPYDGVMLKTAIRREHPQRRELRWLLEDFVFYLPFVGSFLNRLGAVRACQENAERLLRLDHLVAVFPEGVKGTGRLYRDRYKLQRFGRGGFIRLCLRTHTPVIPCVIVGAEDSTPLVFRIEHLSKLMGIPYIPITPTFPLLGPLGLLPAPTRWSISFGDPITFDGYGPAAAEDDVLVGRLSERVRATMQVMIDRAIAGRRSVWWG